jgi:hypothetical protein
MKQLILNFQNDSEATGGMMTSSSRVASRNYANHIQVPESEKERKMSDISGRKCLEQLEKFNHVGLWAKMFSALLIGQEGWYSTRCKLTWKLRGTKYGRMYCQLQVSTLPIEEIGFGLLPTPKTLEAPSASWEKRNPESKYKPGVTLTDMKVWGLLPTPTAMDSTNATATMKSSQVKEGSMHSVTPTRAMSMGMLPTPRTSDMNHPGVHGQGGQDLRTVIAGMLPTPTCQDAKQKENSPSQQHKVQELAIRVAGGTGSQLNPLFVLEMMGFPPDWTELPFLSGETNQSKPLAMQ